MLRLLIIVKGLCVHSLASAATRALLHSFPLSLSLYLPFFRQYHTIRKSHKVCHEHLNCYLLSALTIRYCLTSTAAAHFNDSFFMGCGAFIILISTAPNLWILIGVSVHAEMSHYLALAMNVNALKQRKIHTYYGKKKQYYIL